MQLYALGSRGIAHTCSDSLAYYMGANADPVTDETGDANVAFKAQASPDSHQPAAIDQPLAQSTLHLTRPEAAKAGPSSSTRAQASFTREQGLQEAQLKPLQDADFEVDFSLPPPHPRATSDITESLGTRTALQEGPHTERVFRTAGLPKQASTSEGASSLAVSGSSASPFALSNQDTHSARLSSSSAQAVAAAAAEPPDSGAQAFKSPLADPEGPHADSVGKQPEGQAGINLQPATPPLQTPAGQTPISRPASVQEGEEAPPSGALRQGSLQNIAKGIQAAIERKLR